MARISYAPIQGGPFKRLLGHNPEMMEAFYQASGVLNKTSLSKELREEVRATMAQVRACAY